MFRNKHFNFSFAAETLMSLRVRIEMDLREAPVNPLHLHTVCHRDQQQVAEEMVQQRNCNAAMQLWDVGVLKEQGRKKKKNSPNQIAGSKQRVSPRATWREREREREGGREGGG